MSDERIVEVMANRIQSAWTEYAGEAFTPLVGARPLAVWALAALRDAGFDVYRPGECEAVTVEPYSSVDNLLYGKKVQDTACHLRPGTYRLVPVESPKENQ